MNYATHLLVYPGIILAYVYGLKPYMATRAKDNEQKEWEMIPAAKKVDPDLFNPFTPIPYHNNPELTYVFSHINMYKHLNKNHINPETYVWKDFHNSFDHNHQNAYLYDWVSMTGPKE
jgi:hypothetical protein